MKVMTKTGTGEFKDLFSEHAKDYAQFRVFSSSGSIWNVICGGGNLYCAEELLGTLTKGVAADCGVLEASFEKAIKE